MLKTEKVDFFVGADYNYWMKEAHGSMNIEFLDL